jgi:hypothetical protein
MASQLLHAGINVVSGEVALSHGEIQPQTFLHRRYGHGPGGGETIMTVPAVLDGRLPPRDPGAAHRGLQHETALVNKDNGTACTPGFFYPGPVLDWPLPDGLLITFAGTPFGLLGGSTGVGA